MKPIDLTEWRLINRVSQRFLARVLKLNPSTIWRYEHGKNNIPGHFRVSLLGAELLIKKIREEKNKINNFIDDY